MGEEASRTSRALARASAGLLRPLAADEARAAFWTRHVRVGVAQTEVTACVVIAYVTVADRPHHLAVIGMALLVMAVSPLLLAVPMQQLSTSFKAPLLFYGWSITAIVVIAVVAYLDGGTESPLMWLFVLTMTFAALAYPSLGVFATGLFMIAAYLTVAALSSSVDSHAVMVSAALFTYTDMTAWVSRNQWDTYRQQQLLTARLAEVDRAREEFVATTSHELRTPVTSILGYVELLEESEAAQNPDSRRQLATIRRNAERLRDLSSDLLAPSDGDVTRRRGGATQPDATEVDLIEIAHRVRDTVAPLALAQRTTLVLDVQDEPLLVSGPTEQIERALLNLVSNAVKYSPDGGDVSCVLTRAGDTAMIDVRDTGIGMAEDDVAQLFTRFFRADSARDRGISGVGLGLSIVHEIVTAHGGSIEVFSTLGHGTSIVVALPSPHRVDPPAPVTSGRTRSLD